MDGATDRITQAGVSAASTIVSQWGAPGAIIILEFIFFGIIIFGLYRMVLQERNDNKEERKNTREIIKEITTSMDRFTDAAELRSKHVEVLSYKIDQLVVSTNEVGRKVENVDRSLLTHKS